MGLMMKTAPFLLFRLLVYFGITVGFFLITGTGASIGYGIGHIAANAPAGGMLGGLIGFGIACAVLYFIREYLLYMVKAGHIAVLVELTEGREIPGGKSQIAYARERVKGQFATSSLLFGLDQLIKGILRTFNRMSLSIASMLPLPGASGLVRLLNTIFNLSLTYLDEVILAYLMKIRAENPWDSGCTALVLYAQNYKAFLKNALWLAVVIWALTFTVFLLILGPVAVLVGLFPGTAGPLTLITALVFSWGIKQAVIEPFGMTVLMKVFFKVTEGQTANPDWEAKLDSISSKFGELKARARDYGRAKPSPSPLSASVSRP